MRGLWAILALLLLLGGCRTATEAEGGAAPMPGGGDPMTQSTMAENETMESTAVAEYQRITAAEAYERMASHEVTIVDVRTESEYREGHIENAILVPNETIGDEAPAALPDKDATLLIYCRSGRRSREASEKLLALGYRNVFDFGGINDWPYDTVKE